MKRKNFGMLFGLLAVLAGSAFLLANPFKKPELDATGAVSGGEAAGSGKLLVDATQDKLSAISITPAGGEEFRLNKDGDVWYAVQGDKKFRAEMERVDKLLEALPGLRSETFVTENEGKYAELGLTDELVLKVAVYAGGEQPIASLLVGNAAPGYSTCFLRVGEDTKVYEATQNIKSLAGFSYRDFRSKSPWNFDSQLVSKLTVRPVAGQPEIFVKKEGVWQTSSGANANQNLLVSLLNDWSKVKVSDFADDVTPGTTPFDATAEGADAGGTGGKDAAGKDLPATHKIGTEANLLAETPQGKYSLTLGVKEAGLYYVSDQDQLVYKLGEPDLKFFRELKHAELKIVAAESGAADAGATDAAAGSAASAPGDSAAAPPAGGK